MLFIVGTLFVRTRGQVMGSPDDRFFWGRWQIWNVSLRIVLDRPFLGHGFQTYLEKRNQFMTPALKAFGPLNTEAKNLLLNIAVEFGIVGVAVFAWLIIAFFRLMQTMLRRYPHGMYGSLWLAGRDVLIALLVCGTADTPVLERYRVPSSWMLMLVLGLIANAALSPSTPSETAKRLSSASRRPFTVNRLTLWSTLTVLFILGSAPFASGYLQFRHYRNAIPTFRTQNPDRSRFTPLVQIAPALRYALIASEDGYFLQHHGVDWQALHRALRVNIRNLRFKQGGSTITMQTARYLLLGREKTLPRKVAEVLLALEMEKQLSKERILELYLNSARFGLGAEDIGTACAVCFGKEPSELTLAEAGFLAGVLPEPPRTREELTVEKVERCKHRALGRLAYFFPERYSRQRIERALQERIEFVWQKGGL